MNISEAVQAVSSVALVEFELFVNKLRMEPKEHLLLARAYGSQMALISHRISKMNEVYDQVTVTSADARALGAPLSPPVFFTGIFAVPARRFWWRFCLSVANGLVEC